MTEVGVDSDAEREWAADMLYGSEPSAAPPTENLADDEGSGADTGCGTVDLDETDTAEPRPNADEPDDVNAGAKKTALVLGAGLALAVVAIVAALVRFSDTTSPPPPRGAPPAAAAPTAPAPTTAVPHPDHDQAIPYTASADCPAGSSSAQALTDTASDSAWVCVRGAQGAMVDGQVLRIDLGRTHLLSAVSVTPGWVAKTPGGKDEWLQHRVVTRLQHIFNDDDRTIFTQDTGNTHGPVTTPLPRKVLASRVTVVVLQTSRPPASPLPTADLATVNQPGFVESVLGESGAPLAPEATQTTVPDPAGEQASDPVDATFAMTALKFFGHQPN